MVLKMTSKELLLVADLLNLAHDEFSNHGCNDLPKEFLNNWTLKEKQQLMKEYHQLNGDIEEYNENDLYFQDSSLMWLLAEKIRDMVYPSRKMGDKE
jgi:hypothetical protein